MSEAVPAAVTPTPPATVTPPAAAEPQKPAAAAAAPVEKPAAAPAATPAAEPSKVPEPKDSQRFALLTKQARQLQADRQKFKVEARQEREKLTAERARFDADTKDYAEYKALKLKAKTDVAAFQKHFYGENWFPVINEYVANDSRPTPALLAADVDEKVSQKVSELKQENDKRWKALEADRAKQAAANDAQTERAFAQQAAEWVAGKAEKYDLTNRTKQQWRVADLIKRNYLKTGEIISVEEAADAVEKFLEQEGKTYLDSPKLKPQPAPAAAQPSATTKEQPRSLTNDMVAATPAAFTPGIISEDEAVKRALAAYKKNRSVPQGA